jgi:methyl-accepting chemotaxis protein
MKLHVKLMISLLSALLVLLLLFQTIQYSKTKEHVEKLSAATLDILRQKEKQQAVNLFTSIEEATKGSIERGEMLKFSRLVKKQKQIEGLNEFSLYDASGKISHSSDEQNIGNLLPEDVRSNIKDDYSMFIKEAEDNIEIYKPQKITAEWIRCHLDWKLGGIGGITHLKFSKNGLLLAEEKTIEAMNKMDQTLKRNTLLLTFAFLILFGWLIWFCVKKFMREQLEHLHHISTKIKEKVTCGEISSRVYLDKIIPEFRPIASSVNEILDTLQVFLEHLPIPIQILDKDLKVLFMNESGKKICGVQEVSGCTCSSLFHSDHCESGKCAVKQCLESNAIEASDTIIRPLGKEHKVHYIGIPVKNKSGETVAAYEIIIDQTELKTAHLIFEKIARYQNAEIEKLSDALQEMALGHFDVHYHAESGDSDTKEVANSFVQIESALKNTIDQLCSTLGHIQNYASELSAASTDLSGAATQLAAGSEEMNSQAGTVACATEQMNTNIKSLSSFAEELSSHTSSVSTTSEEMSSTVSTVESAVHSMKNSIDQILNNAGKATRISSDAKSVIDNATLTMKTLEQAATEINQVTDSIKNIADQTNMLALNATIEAASAGEAGKGFGVVASEVKELSHKSAAAADDITSRIEGIQSSTAAAMEAIARICDVTGHVQTAIQTILKAVDQQSHATAEIASNMVQTTQGAKSITTSISEVANHSKQMASNVSEVASGSAEIAHNVSGMSRQLNDSGDSINYVSESANRLNHIAKKLEDLTSGFRL